MCENDGLYDPFITYFMKEVSQTNKTKTICGVQIHYFENFFDYLGKLKASTYNIFELREDFI